MGWKTCVDVGVGLMQKKADWPIEFCVECRHKELTPIHDAMCAKTGKYLWINAGRMVSGKVWPEGKSEYSFMPEWCPLEKYEL